MAPNQTRPLKSDKPTGKPTDKPKIVLSASRRTDIPGGYTPWFLEGIKKGCFTVTNPFNRQTRTLDARPSHVHSIVFWSKNYTTFIELGAPGILDQMGYNLFFNFTINSSSPLLEPGVPKTEHQLDQAARLCDQFSPDQVAWRFDPICFFEKDGKPTDNLKEFESISQAMAGMGITRCITSFYDPYKKVDLRLRRMAESKGPVIKFVDPGLGTRHQIIRDMAATLKSKNIKLYLCCEAGLYNSLGPLDNLYENACINGKLLKKLFGGFPETSRDYGQRTKQGCFCSKSVDIGSYDIHPCFHNCLFCYARTGSDIISAQGNKNEN